MCQSVTYVEALSVLRASPFSLGLLASALLVPALAETPARLHQPPPHRASRAPAPTPAAAPARAGAAPHRRRADCRCAVGVVPIKATMRVVYLGKQYEEPLPLSYAEKSITDKGIQGARLMLKEANQAGNFVGHSFELVEAIVPVDGDVVAKAKEVLAKGDRFIIADLEPPISSPWPTCPRRRTR